MDKILIAQRKLADKCLRCGCDYKHTRFHAWVASHRNAKKKWLDYCKDCCDDLITEEERKAKIKMNKLNRVARKL